MSGYNTYLKNKYQGLLNKKKDNNITLEIVGPVDENGNPIVIQPTGPSLGYTPSSPCDFCIDDTIETNIDIDNLLTTKLDISGGIITGDLSFTNGAILDMCLNRIINIPDASDPFDPINKKQFDASLSNIIGVGMDNKLDISGGIMYGDLSFNTGANIDMSGNRIIQLADATDPSGAVNKGQMDLCLNEKLDLSGGVMTGDLSFNTGANIDMSGNRIIQLADATDPSGAVNKGQMDLCLNEKLDLSGGIMTGDLSFNTGANIDMSGNRIIQLADATDPSGAVNKGQMDLCLNEKLDLSGGVMTGNLTFNTDANIDMSGNRIIQLADATDPSGAVNKGQMDLCLNEKLDLSGGIMTGDLIFNTDANIDMSDNRIIQLADATDPSGAVNKGQMDLCLNEKLDLSGGVMTGNLTFNTGVNIDMSGNRIIQLADATDPSGAVNKGQMDSCLNEKLDLSGGVMTGDLSFNTGANIDMSGNRIIQLADATDPSGAVNKGQMDSCLNKKLDLSGGVITGDVSFTNGSILDMCLNRIINVPDASNPFDAVNKKQLDEVAINGAGLDKKLDISGGVMTGNLSFNTGANIDMSGNRIIQLADATDPSGAVNKGQMDLCLNEKLDLSGGIMTGDLIFNTDANIDMSDNRIIQLADATDPSGAVNKGQMDLCLNEKLDISGGVMTGNLTFNTGVNIDMSGNRIIQLADATDPSGAVNKGQMDLCLNEKLDLSGGVMTGNLSFNTGANIDMNNNIINFIKESNFFYDNGVKLRYYNLDGNKSNERYTTELQPFTIVHRTGRNFAFYKDGSFSDSELDSGGGDTFMTMEGNNGNKVKIHNLLDMNNKKIVNLLNGVNDGEAVNKRQMDLCLNEKLNLSGGVMTGDVTFTNGVILDMCTNKIINIGNGTVPGDAVNKNQLDKKLDLSGGVITGDVSFTNGSILDMCLNRIINVPDASNPFDAVNKKQLDEVAINGAGLDKKLDISGGVMTGDLIFNTDANIDMSGNRIIQLSKATDASGAVNKGQMDLCLNEKLDLSGGVITGDLSFNTGANIDMSGNRIIQLADATDPSGAVNKGQMDLCLNEKLDLSGGVMTGNLTFNTDANIDMSGNRIIQLSKATDASGAVNKEQMDLCLNEKLDLSGGIMTGDLIFNTGANIDMSGNRIIQLADATDPSGAVNKGQMDSCLNEKLDLSGGVMTGNLTFNTGANIDMSGNRIIQLADATDPSGAVNKGQMDLCLNEKLDLSGGVITGDLSFNTGANIDMSGNRIIQLADATDPSGAVNKGQMDLCLNEKLDLSGGVMTGNLTFNTGVNIDMSGNRIIQLADATDPSGAVNKGQMDLCLNEKLDLSGGIMTGDLIFNTGAILDMCSNKIINVPDASNPFDAVNKKQLDEVAINGAGLDKKLDISGGVMTGDLSFNTGANIDMSGNRIIQLADATDPSGAVNKGQMDLCLNEKLDLSGGVMTGNLSFNTGANIDMSGNRIINLADATDPSGAVNKGQMDLCLNEKLDLSGGVMTGDLSFNTGANIDMSGNRIIKLARASDPSGAVNKEQMDSCLNEKLNLSGGVMTGELNMNNNIIKFNNSYRIQNDSDNNIAIYNATNKFLALDDSRLYTNLNIDMQNNKIINLSNGSDGTHAVNKSQLDTKLDLSGGIMTGELNMNNNIIKFNNSYRIQSDSDNNIAIYNVNNNFLALDDSRLYTNLNIDMNNNNISNINELSFDPQDQVKIRWYNLNGPDETYTTEFQNSTIAHRTGKNFAFYKNGSFVATALDPGSGGETFLTMEGDENNKVKIHNLLDMNNKDITNVKELNTSAIVIPQGSNSTNSLFFKGVTGDIGPNIYYSGITERLYNDQDKSELVIFKGNDQFEASGPDRIKLLAYEIQLNIPTGYGLNSNTYTTITQDEVLKITGSEITCGKPITFDDPSKNNISKISSENIVDNTLEAIEPKLFGLSNSKIGKYAEFSNNGFFFATSSSNTSLPGYAQVYEINNSTSYNKLGNDISFNSTQNIIAISDNGRVIAVNYSVSSTEDRIRVFELINDVWTQKGSDIIEPNNFNHTIIKISNNGNDILFNAINTSSSILAAKIYRYTYISNNWDISYNFTPQNAKDIYFTASSDLSLTFVSDLTNINRPIEIFNLDDNIDEITLFNQDIKYIQTNTFNNIAIILNNGRIYRYVKNSTWTTNPSHEIGGLGSSINEISASASANELVVRTSNDVRTYFFRNDNWVLIDIKNVSSSNAKIAYSNKFIMIGNDTDNSNKGSIQLYDIVEPYGTINIKNNINTEISLSNKIEFKSRTSGTTFNDNILRWKDTRNNNFLFTTPNSEFCKLSLRSAPSSFNSYDAVTVIEFQTTMTDIPLADVPSARIVSRRDLPRFAFQRAYLEFFNCWNFGGNESAEQGELVLMMRFSNIVDFYRLINVNGNKITGVGTPTSGTDAANKSYVDSNTFTGQHKSDSQQLRDPSGNYRNDIFGLIAIANGSYKFSSPEYSENINMDETIPVVDLSYKENDKRCFGVISHIYERYEFDNSNNAIYFPHRFNVNSLGEGAIWVCNINGSLENGDFITTSNVPGFGMLQKKKRNFLMNYTVGKITCDCLFNEPEFKHRTIEIFSDRYEAFEEKDISGNITNVKVLTYHFDFTQTRYSDMIGNTYKASFVGCIYHCG